MSRYIYIYIYIYSYKVAFSETSGLGIDMIYGKMTLVRPFSGRAKVSQLSKDKITKKKDLCYSKSSFIY